MNGEDAGVPERPLPFLRRYDPDQVQGSGSPPSQHRQMRPSASGMLWERERGCQLIKLGGCDQGWFDAGWRPRITADLVIGGAA